MTFNPDLGQLQPYPFEKLKALFAGIEPDSARNSALSALNLSIGEPKHATPVFIQDALINNLGGLANYPTTAGLPKLREAIAGWLGRRYGLDDINAEAHILPVNGSREALFALAQTVIDRTAHTAQGGPLVVCPNPFYQIYEGAALLAGAQPYYLNALPDNHFAQDFASVPATVWQRTQLVYVCSPGNPTGRIMPLEEWRTLFELADRYGFVIASDECYSEIYFDESSPPLGGLEAAKKLGRNGYKQLIAFTSLSKRSNVPGMRSGFVAGDAEILKRFLLYRTYHGSAMNPAIQHASIAAWNDEAHVADNRRQYKAKFDALAPILQSVTSCPMPDAAFYFWMRTPGDDVAFVKNLLQQQNVTLLPGSYLARAVNGINPGAGFARIALVQSLAECIEAAERIKTFIQQH